MAFVANILATLTLCLLVLGTSDAFGRKKSDYGDFVVQFSDNLESTPFSWRDCSNGALPTKVSKLSLTPDPVKYPGNATASFEATLTRDVTAPLKVAVKLQRKFIVWLPVGCIRNMGSCTYDDVCPMLEKIKCDSEDESNSNCHCPFKKGTYTLPPTSFVIDEKVVPFSPTLARGQYRAEVKMSDAIGDVACLYTEFTIA